MTINNRNEYLAAIAGKKAAFESVVSSWNNMNVSTMDTLAQALVPYEVGVDYLTQLRHAYNDIERGAKDNGDYVIAKACRARCTDIMREMLAR